jgi:hypothetical protein
MEIDPAKLNSPHVRNEVMALLEQARVGLALEMRPELRKAYRVPTFVDSIVLLDMPEANAFAFTNDGRATIAITLGVPLITRALFIAALSEAEVLDNIGDVHYLRIPYKPRTHCDWANLAELFSAFSLDNLYAWAKSVPIMPQTPDNSGRGDLAIILSMQAWSFIVFHELGHHAMEHLGTPAGEPAGVAYTEIEELAAGRPFVKPSDELFRKAPTNTELPESLLLRHANELEADRYAIAKMYGHFFRAHAAIPIGSANFRKMTTISERSRTRLWLVTIGLVFLLFEVAGRIRVANSHPRPLFRLQHLLEFTCAQAGTALPRSSLKEFEKGYADAMRDLTFIADRLGIRDLYVPQPDDEVYKDCMMQIRSSRPRVFKGDALTDFG